MIDESDQIALKLLLKAIQNVSFALSSHDFQFLMRHSIYKILKLNLTPYNLRKSLWQPNSVTIKLDFSGTASISTPVFTPSIAVNAVQFALSRISRLYKTFVVKQRRQMPPEYRSASRRAVSVLLSKNLYWHRFFLWMSPVDGK